MPRECRTCTKVVSDRANFCPNCGTSLRPSPATAPPPGESFAPGPAAVSGQWVAWVVILFSVVWSFVAVAGLAAK